MVSTPEVKEGVMVRSTTNFAKTVHQNVIELLLIHFSLRTSFEIVLSVEPLDSDDSKVVLNNEVSQLLVSDLTIVVEVISVCNIKYLTLSGSEKLSKCIFDLAWRKFIVMVTIETPQHSEKLLSNFLG